MLSPTYLSLSSQGYVASLKNPLPCRLFASSAQLIHSQSRWLNQLLLRKRASGLVQSRSQLPSCIEASMGHCVRYLPTYLTYLAADVVHCSFWTLRDRMTAPTRTASHAIPEMRGSVGPHLDQMRITFVRRAIQSDVTLGDMLGLSPQM